MTIRTGFWPQGLPATPPPWAGIPDSHHVEFHTASVNPNGIRISYPWAPLLRITCWKKYTKNVAHPRKDTHACHGNSPQGHACLSRQFVCVCLGTRATESWVEQPYGQSYAEHAKAAISSFFCHSTMHGLTSLRPSEKRCSMSSIRAAEQWKQSALLQSGSLACLTTCFEK